MILINGRNLGVHTTGVQRYTKKIIECWERADYKLIAPVHPQHGIKGHLWEQFILPCNLTTGCLWSPSNTGPLLASKQVVTIHDVVPFDHPEWLNSRFVSWYKFLQPKLVKKAAHIITISEFSKNRIMDVLNVPESKITVIYNGVDPSNHNAILPRSSLNLPFNRYVLTVGSIEPRKNVSRLISAWNLIKNSISEDVGLVVVGAKGLARVFSNTDEDLNSRDENRVHFTGHVSDDVLCSLYSHADLFCYPSLYEGFGLPPLEAMSYGVPVLTSNTTAMAELCNGSAVLIDPLDVDDIASAILKSLTNPDAIKIRNARALVSALSWQKCAMKTFDIINGVC